MYYLEWLIFFIWSFLRFGCWQVIKSNRLPLLNHQTFSLSFWRSQIRSTASGGKNPPNFSLNGLVLPNGFRGAWRILTMTCPAWASCSMTSPRIEKSVWLIDKRTRGFFYKVRILGLGAANSLNLYMQMRSFGSSARVNNPPLSCSRSRYFWARFTSWPRSTALIVISSEVSNIPLLKRCWEGLYLPRIRPITRYCKGWSGREKI